MKRAAVANIALSVMGAALFVWLVQLTGVETIARGFASVGLWFLPILLLSLTRFILRSRAWTALIDTPVALKSATAATIYGDALGNVTPLGLLASEPAKAIYLRRFVPAQTGLAALTAENFFYSVSVALYVIAGSAALLLGFDVHNAVRAFGFVALGGMTFVLFAAGWLAWQQPSVISAVLSRLPSRKLASLIARVRTFEASAFASTRGGGHRLLTVAICETVFHVVSFLECWLTVWLLTGNPSLLTALVFDAVQRVVNIVFKVVPMRLGVEEGGNALVAVAIGLPADVGVQIGLVRKVRLLFWAGAGFALMGRRAGIDHTRPV